MDSSKITIGPSDGLSSQPVAPIIATSELEIAKATP